MIIKTFALRILIDKCLDRALGDLEWNMIQTQGFYSDYRRGAIGPDGIAETVKQWRVATQERQALPSLNAVSPLRADPARGAREELLSYLFSLMAARLEKVETFRSEVLSGKLLKVEDVEPWIKGHGQRETYTVWLQVAVLRPDLDNLVNLGQPVTITQESPHTDLDLKWLKYILPGQKSQRVPTAAGGVLDNLRLVSEHVAARTGCSAEYSTGFVLSGEPLPFFSCEQTVLICSTDLCSALNRIELKIDPTLSPRQVAEVYRQVRGRVFGRRYRAMSEKHIRLALFAFSRPNGESLKIAMGAWNKLYPKWRYRQESNFGRDRIAAKRRALETLDTNPTSTDSVETWLLGAKPAAQPSGPAHKRRTQKP